MSIKACFLWNGAGHTILCIVFFTLNNDANETISFARAGESYANVNPEPVPDAGLFMPTGLIGLTVVGKKNKLLKIEFKESRKVHAKALPGFLYPACKRRP
nr:hypothetical protein [uncultured Desulfobacter sp.]